MKTFFSKDSYDTLEDMPRYWGDRISLHSRWAFYIPFIKLIFASRKMAVQGTFDDEKWEEICLNIFKYVEKCGGRFHIKGIDNLRKSVGQSVVVVSNHMSTLETAIFPCIINPVLPMTYVVKESLVKQRVFGPVMRSREPIVVSRKNPKEDLIKVLTEGQKILEKGRSLVIFPQSTRHTEFIPEKFNSLGIKLARRASVRVIPAAIKTDFWGNSKIKFMKDMGPLSRDKPIHMTFGEPMEIEGTGKKQHQQVIDFITSHMKEWNAPK